MRVSSLRTDTTTRQHVPPRPQLVCQLNLKLNPDGLLVADSSMHKMQENQFSSLKSLSLQLCLFIQSMRDSFTLE